jgi:hypothetical protein
LALAGAWLGLSRAPVTARIDNFGYHVAGEVMRPVSAGTYSGNAAVVIRHADGTVRAAAAGRFGSQPLQGICILVTGSGREQCIFVVGKQSFTAEDRLDGLVWHRRYSDGLSIDIQLIDSSDPVPVPLPVGRAVP